MQRHTRDAAETIEIGDEYEQRLKHNVVAPHVHAFALLVELEGLPEEYTGSVLNEACNSRSRHSNSCIQGMGALIRDLQLHCRFNVRR